MGWSQLIATVSPTARILLALFCYCRFRSSCPRSDWRSRQPARKMNSLGWAATRVRFYFERSREALKSPPVDVHNVAVEKLLCRPRQFANLGQSRTRKIGIQTDRIWHISVRMPQPDHHKPALVETFQQCASPLAISIRPPSMALIAAARLLKPPDKLKEFRAIRALGWLRVVLWPNHAARFGARLMTKPPWKCRA